MGKPVPSSTVTRRTVSWSAAANSVRRSAGAIVCDGIALTALERHGDSVAVKTNRGDAVRARAVVVGGTLAESPSE